MNSKDSSLAVKGFVMDDSKVLVLTKPSGEIDFPGGCVEEGENHKACLKRELKEETGLTDVEIHEVVVTWHFLRKMKTPIKVFVYRCVYKGGKIELSAEHRKFYWMEIGGIMQILSNCANRILDDDKLLNAST